jgi:hypothetical protein
MSLIGVDRKRPANGQSDAIDPEKRPWIVNDHWLTAR